MSEIRFEERLATANGLVVMDVIVSHGHLAVAFGVPAGPVMSTAEIDARVRQIRISKSQVLDLLSDAMAELRAEIGAADRRITILRDTTRAKALRLLELGDRYLSLLDGSERDAFDGCMVLARRIARRIGPVATGLN